MLKKIFKSFTGKKHERSNYLNELKETQSELNKVSPTFCVAKWKQVTLHLHNGQTHSCHHPVPHTIPLDEIQNDSSALHNTLYKKKRREELLEGIQTEECNYCWNIENSIKDNFSDRILKSNEQWAKPFIHSIPKIKDDKETVPSYLEVSFSSKCNFKCSYCNPGVSSKWQEEVLKKGPFELSTGKYNDLSYFQNIHEEQNNPYIEAFWDWFPKIYKDLRVLRITGGEPLLSQNTLRLIDFIENNPNRNLEFSVNTNLGVPKNVLTDFVNRLKRLEGQKTVAKTIIFTSVDTWGSQAEYIRFGLNFKHFWSNVELILNSTKKTSVTIMATLNVMSTPQLRSLLENVLSLKRLTTYRNSARLHIDMSYLRYPDFLSIGLINDTLRNNLYDCVAFMKSNEILNHNPGFHPQETEKLERIYELSKSIIPSEERKNLLKAFFQFVEEHDRRRKTHFAETFPELIEELFKWNKDDHE